ncbi:MAG: oxidoreductase [Myxococcaceae bacterium]|nr:oxidoreductase [Myxococcaceae bacterium]
MSTAPVRIKPRPFEVVVSRVIQETPDTVTLDLFTGNERIDYKAGQFLTIDVHQFKVLGRFASFLEDLKKRKEPPRAYSVGSAPHEPFISITVKEEPYVPGVSAYPPLLSPLLVHQTQVGTRMIVTGFTGAYTLPDEPEPGRDHVVHICAGSGIVPNFSILKEDLRVTRRYRHTLLFSNKTYQDICYADPLRQLERDFPERLKVVHFLTRETDPRYFGEKVRKGRITAEAIRELVPDLDRALFYLCGPAITGWERRKAMETKSQATPRFLETILEHLHSLGVDTKKVKRESWG